MRTASRYVEILRGAEAIAARAAEMLIAMRGRALEVNRKELRDVVTEADLASERIVLDGIRALTPNAAIISEEAGASEGEGAACWLVDPLGELRGGTAVVLRDDGVPGRRANARRRRARARYRSAGTLCGGRHRDH